MKTKTTIATPGMRAVKIVDRRQAKGLVTTIRDLDLTDLNVALAANAIRIEGTFVRLTAFGLNLLDS